MRAQASLIALVIMIAVVLALSLGFISFFNHHYLEMSRERARIAYLAGIPASITIIPVHSSGVVGPTGDRVWCHLVEVANIGSAELTIWVAFGGGYVDERGFPRLSQAHEVVEVVIVKIKEGFLEVPRCPEGSMEGVDVTYNTLQAMRVYTVDKWRLDELGNPPGYTFKGFTRLTLKPGESKTFYVKAASTEDTWTLAALISNFNNNLYMVGVYRLPH